MLLVGIEGKHTPNALVVPRKGDSVEWIVGMPEFILDKRIGIVEGVAVDDDEEYVFYAVTKRGESVWGRLHRILSINGEPVPNTKANLE